MAKKENTIVVQTRAGIPWFKIIIYLMIGVIAFSVAKSFISAADELFEDVSTWITGLAIDGSDDENTGEGQTEETRIQEANLLIKDLDPDEEMPENFDTDLLLVWEDSAYTKTYSHLNSSGKRVYSMVYKFYEDEALTDPMWVYSYNIKLKATNFFKTKWEYYSETQYISQDGLAWSSNNSYDWKNKAMFLENGEDEVIKYTFTTAKKTPASFFVGPVYMGQFVDNGMTYYKTNVKITSDVNFYKQAEIGNEWVAQNEAWLQEEFFDINEDDFTGNRPININEFYEIKPIKTSQTKNEILLDGVTLFLPKDALTIEDFTEQEQWGYKKFINYTYTSEEMHGQYKAYAFDAFETFTASVALKSQIDSIYFSATTTPILRTSFGTVDGDVFITTLTNEGIRIITLPYAVEVETTTSYQFSIIQKNSNGEQIGSTLVSESNTLEVNGNKTFDNSLLVIPFDENFELETGVAEIEITIIGNNTTVFDNATSVIVVEG